MSLATNRPTQEALRTPAPDLTSLFPLGASLAGGLLLAAGLKRGGTFGGVALMAAGGACLYKATQNYLGNDRDPRGGVRAQHGYRYEQSIAIRQPRKQVFEFWRELSNLPLVMRHLESVQELDHTHSRWRAHGPFDKPVEWEAEIINEREGELIAWQSTPGGVLDTAGSVRFEPGQHSDETVVHVQLKYDPPGGKAGAIAAWLLGSGLEGQAAEDLRRCKALLETGEIPTTQGQPRGACGGSSYPGGRR